MDQGDAEPVDWGQSDGLYRLLIDSVKDYAIFLLDAKGIVRSWNPGAERIKGYTAREIVGQHFSRFYLPEDVANGKCDNALQTALTDGRFEDYGWRVRKDGTGFWASVVITTLRSASGQHVGFAKVTRDLTDSAYRVFVEATHAIVWSTDGNGHPNVDSPSWRAFTGQSEEDWRGLRGWAPIHPDDEPLMRVLWARAKAQRTTLETEFRLRRFDGVYVWMAARALPFLSPTGAVREWFGVTFDISARKQVEVERTEALQREKEARAQAESASRTKDEFLATVSHELRNPLNVILGWSKVLLLKDLPDDVRRHVATIERNARSQARLIDDVLDMSRIISGKLSLDLGQANVAQAVADATAAARPAADAKGVEIMSTVEAGSEVHADQLRLQQIISNLVANAVKFTPRGGRVTVAAALTGQDLRIVVRDTGEGIDRALLSAIFEPFRQADASTTRRHGGLGLGLAIVRQLAHAHGGRVWAESEGKGHGATFMVEMPARPGAQPSPLRPPVPPAGDYPALRGTRVLVVDDEHDTVELLRVFLTAAGAKVETAASAEEALVMLSGFRPEVLVSDVGMPDTDGYGLIRRVRALSAAAGGETPAVAVTAYSRPEDAERALAAGFQVHFGKPVDLVRLTRAIADLAGVSAQPDVSAG